MKPNHLLRYVIGMLGLILCKVTFANVFMLSSDYSDAPSSYGNPSHTVVAGYYLGATAPDTDSFSTPTASATGDDVTGGDDEDGVIIPQMWQGAQTQLSVTVAGANGYLQAWFDWNGDGDFNDAGEQVATNLQDATATSTSDLNSAAGIIDFVVTPPLNATLNTTYARLRWSTTSNITATGVANDGEVEDYALTLQTLPTQVCDNTAWYATNPASGGNGVNLYKMTFTGGIVAITQVPRPAGTPNNPLFYSNMAYREADGFFYGTSLNGNGVGSFNTTPSIIKIGANGARVAIGWPVGLSNTVAMPSSTFGSDGYFYANNQAGTVYKIDVTTSPPTVISQTTSTTTVNGPQDIVLSADNRWAYGFYTVVGGAQFARLDLTQTSGPWQLIGTPVPQEGTKVALGAIFRDNTGAIYAAHNGTGNLYRVLIAEENTATPTATFTRVASTPTPYDVNNNDGAFCSSQLFPVGVPTDYADAPASYGAPSHKISTGLQLGTVPDAETGPQPNATATGDNNTGTNDEDGITASAVITGNVAMTVSANVTGANGLLQAWADWNRDGDFNDAGEQMATNLKDGGSLDTNTAIGITSFSVTPPKEVSLGATFARFRWSTVSVNATQEAIDGEVEDYAINVVNLAPLITSSSGAATATISVPEEQLYATTITATDANSDTLTYSITGGVDAAKFGMSPSSGMLSFNVPPNYEAPIDANGDNNYEVQVSVADGRGGVAVQNLILTVTNIAENSPPTITSNGGGATATISLAENQQAVTTVMATDPDADPLTFSLAGGVDIKNFTIDPTTGSLRFITAPDYEQPTDTDKNNTYEVKVSVSDNKGGKDDQLITVTVQNVVEPVLVRVRALLQGPYIATNKIMQDGLRAQNLIPTTQPYSMSPFNYSGQETVTPSRLAVVGYSAVVDWVLVELRSATNTTTVAARKAALLLRDGSIVNAATDSLNIAMTAPNGNYYVVVRHRNHLMVMTASTLPLTNVPTLVDFGLASTLTYGTQARLVSGTTAVMWAGDASISNQIIANGPSNDTSIALGNVITAPENPNGNTNYRLPGYRSSDMDMNGQTLFVGPNNDVNVLVGNVLLHPNNATFAGNFIVNGSVPKPLN